MGFTHETHEMFTHTYDKRHDEVNMMPTVMTTDQRQAARREMVRQMEQGTTVSDAQRLCPVPMHRRTAYRLLKRVQHEGELAFVERRHGHPIKLLGEVLVWVLEYCQGHAAVSISELQRLVAERFCLSMSISQLNRVRVAHGVSRQAPLREKKPKNGLGDRLGIS